MKKMMYCNSCKSYTLMQNHCGLLTTSAHPPRFDPNDRYGDYRRRMKAGDSHERNDHN